MSLTPVDILHTQFKTTLRGYNKAQVDAFARAAREALEEGIKARSELQHRLEVLEEEVERIRKIEATMTSALTIAQKSADELRAAAHEQAEAIVKEAEQSRVKMMVDSQSTVERLRAEIALLESARDRFEAEFRAVLSSYSEWLEKRRTSDELHAEVA